MLIKSVNGGTPRFGKNCFFADNATVVGNVLAGNECSFWFNSVVRGDVNSIKIGDRVNIQDGAIIHCTYQKAATTIGDDVSVGHNAIVHGCTLQNKVLVGMGAIVMDNCEIESYSIIAAGAVITQGTKVESRSIFAGVPAKKIAEIDKNLVEGEIERIAQNYIKYASWFRE